MLKYFKKQKGRVRRNSSRNDDDSSSNGGLGDDRCNAATSTTAGGSNSKRNSLRSTSSFCDEVLLSTASEFFAGGDDDHACATSCGGSSLAADDDIFRYHSRLSMTLPAIVNDPNCLSYFVQYLDQRNALPLLKFYLDTENFKAAALGQLEREQLAFSSAEGEKHVETKVPEAEEQMKAHEHSDHPGVLSDADDEDEENVNSVPELKTLYAMSLRKPLTDDEKSQLYAETSKQIANKNLNNNNINNMSNGSSRLKASSELSLCSLTSTTTTEPEGAYTGRRISAASVKDALAIYKKYMSPDAKQFVALPVTILSQISLLLCKCDDKAGSEDSMKVSGTFEGQPANSIEPRCFDEAQHYVLEQLENEYLNDFLQSTFYCKYCIGLIEGTEMQQLTIYDILYSEVTLFFFMEFLEQRGEQKCLDFWSTAINFRKSYTMVMKNEENGEDEVQRDAMIIYDKFFSLQADNRLWMSDKLRSCVEERICAPEQVAYCFDLPLQVMAKYLEQKYFEDFQRSKLFETYVNELKMKLQDEHQIAGNLPANQKAGVKSKATPNHTKWKTQQSTLNRHRKTLSDCTNESSRELFKHISQHNTLLAMDSSTLPMHLKQLHNNGTNMNIDARQLTNPKLLWHRSNSSEGGLKFGRINALGRYERDFESVEAALNGSGPGGGKHHLWSWSEGGNKIKNAMRKLVNLPEEKVQEEIAWQVAEMIVKDVTNITLKGVNVESEGTNA